jgi:hypothetical protein
MALVHGDVGPTCRAEASSALMNVRGGDDVAARWDLPVCTDYMCGCGDTACDVELASTGTTLSVLKYRIWPLSPGATRWYYVLVD